MRKPLLVFVAAVSSFGAQAESQFVTGTGALSATGRLDFSVVIPRVLFLQVGTGTTLASNATIDKITFTVPTASVGIGTPVAGVGGDLTGGAVTVRVLANAGTVTLSNATTGPLTSGVAGNPTVPWSDIAVTGGALASTTPGFTNAAIAHPPFNTGAAGGATTTPTTLAATAGLVRREGSWTFAYANTATLPAGTYGDTTGNNGRVTYTAATP